jgi:hypothetical protein
MSVENSILIQILNIWVATAEKRKTMVIIHKETLDEKVTQF